MSSQPSSQFSIGESVHLVADITKTGIIQDIRSLQNGQTRCYVFFTATDRGWHPLENLVPVASADAAPRVVGDSKFLRDLALVKLNSQLTDTLYSYAASRTNVEPYQFKPALKFIESPNQRLLIADGVGLGKTIEAGIIYLEQKARTPDMNRVLIVCPSMLRNKWRDEMLSRFDESFTILDSPALSTKLDDLERFGDSVEIKAIVGMETIRQKRFSDRIDELVSDYGLGFNLVIVDEAHHMRNPGTLTNHVGYTLSEASDSLIMLSATPIQLHSSDLFNLFRILDEGQFQDFEDFESLREPNTFINEASALLSIGNSTSNSAALAALRRVEATEHKTVYIKHPLYTEICHRLSEASNHLTRREIVQLRRDLQLLNTFAPIFNRTTKRDVAPYAVRRSKTIKVELTPEERKFYDGVFDLTWRLTNGDRDMPTLASIQQERQAASCISAARDYILEKFHDPNAELGLEMTSPDLETDDDLDNAGPSARLRELCDQLGDIDSKFELFAQAMGECRKESANSHVLVFAFFKRTLEHLGKELTSHPEFQDVQVFTINGDIPLSERPRIIENFRTQKGFSILLLSEVGGEGLDFQFCDTVVNYDLPWNPMKVEQRIGRIDRYGQNSESIRIYSFFLKDTIEDRILERLYERIGIFEESIGDMEVILGEEISKLQRQIFRSSLTESEQREQAEAIAQSIEFKQKEEDQFRENQEQLMGQDLVFGQQFDEFRNSGKVIAPAELEALVSELLREYFPRVRLMTRQNERFFIRPNVVFRDEIRNYMIRNRYPLPIQQQLVQRLGGRGFTFTFNGEAAHNNPNLELLNIRHPIISLAKDKFSSIITEIPPLSRMGSAVNETEDSSKIGEFAFFIYLISNDSSHKFSSLTPIVVDINSADRREDIEQDILADLQNAHFGSYLPEEADWEFLDEMAFEYFSEYQSALEAETKRRNNALVDMKIAAIKRTASARVNRFSRLLEDASDERIRRMRQGQITRSDAERDIQIAEEEQNRAIAMNGDLVSAGYIRYDLSQMLTLTESDSASVSSKTGEHPLSGIGGTQPDLEYIPRRRSEPA